MALDRREFLTTAGIALAGGPIMAQASAPEDLGDIAKDWDAVRASFALRQDLIHFSSMLFASHPAPVRFAIEDFRRRLDADPDGYLHANNQRLTDETFGAAAQFLGVHDSQVALTDSTTMSVGLVYNGLRLKPGDEILTTEQDYYVTHEAIRQAAERTGATVRKVSLYDDITDVSADEIVNRIAAAIAPETRVLALTWVHSSTGMKLPAADIARAVAEVNAERDEADHVLFCLDAVHGFGCEDFTFLDLGCDFMMAGCHKWLFGPRGTGVVAATTKGLKAISALVPSFTDTTVFQAWLLGSTPKAVTMGRTITPGGFKPYEHVWALPKAFAFQQAIGRGRVRERTRALAAQLKQGLAAMPAIRLETPLADGLSAGIVSFNIDGMSADVAVRSLGERRIVASVAPYAAARIRLTPSIVNTPEEVDLVLADVAAIAA